MPDWPPLLEGGKEEGLTPTPLSGARWANGRSPGTEEVNPVRVGRNTHPPNPKGAAPHSLPWHQVQVPRGVQSQREFRVGSDEADEGLRQVRGINVPLPVPAPASPQHWRLYEPRP